MSKSGISAGTFLCFVNRHARTTLIQSSLTRITHTVLSTRLGNGCPGSQFLHLGRGRWRALARQLRLLGQTQIAKNRGHGTASRLWHCRQGAACSNIAARTDAAPGGNATAQNGTEQRSTGRLNRQVNLPGRTRRTLFGPAGFSLWLLGSSRGGSETVTFEFQIPTAGISSSQTDTPLTFADITPVPPSMRAFQAPRSAPKSGAGR